MSRNFSLRRRLAISLFCVFLLGIAATATYDRLELKEIRERLRHVTPDTAAAFQLNQMAEQDLEFLAFILVPFTVAAMGVILFITHRSFRGIQRASKRAAQIDIERLDARLEFEDLPDEIVPLVQAVNGTLNRLAAAYTAEQRLTANAAHELRTPLAVLQTRLQSAKLGGVMDWNAIERDLAQLQRVVSQILELARRDSRRLIPGSGERAPVNLARALREAAALLLPLAEQTNRTIDINAPDSLMVEVSAEDLRDLLRNLIENALEHGRGTVSGALERTTDRHGPCALITIDDEGPGVPESLREAAFERFRKLSPQSRGAGLGLAIARQIAESHGGTVEFVDAPHGRIRVVLPLGSATNPADPR